MKNNELQNDETETLSGEDEKLRQMMRSLKKAEAPPDFEFRLKSRIANAKPNDFQPGGSSRLRFVWPAALAVLLFGIIFFNSNLFRQEDLPVAESPSGPDFPDVIQPNPPSAPDQKLVAGINTGHKEFETPASENTNKNIAINNTQTSNSRVVKKSEPKEVRKNLPKDDFNPTRDLTIRDGATKIMPKGLDNRSVPEKTPDFDKEGSLSVEDVFLLIGIEAALENNNWKVKSVTKNSMAERSGVKQNDIIKAIGNVQILPETVFEKSFEGKSIKVDRNGIEIVLKLQSFIDQ